MLNESEIKQNIMKSAMFHVDEQN